MDQADLSRRGFLRAASMVTLGMAGTAFGAVVSGCAGAAGSRLSTGGRSGTATAPSPTAASAPTGGTSSFPRADPDVNLALSAAGDEAELRDFCVAAVRAAPGLRTLLQPIQLRQHQHVEALLGAIAGSTAPVKVTPTTPSAVPRRAAQVEDDLKRRLSAAERHRLAGCLAADSGPLARMLASISASHAATVAELRRSS